jgi:hypothetical protein
MSMQTWRVAGRFWRWAVGAVLLIVAVGVGSTACGRHPQELPPPQYTTDATVKDIMEAMVDPSADILWESVATVISEKGVDERFPKTDEEWATLRHAAIMLLEATNLLVIPGRPVARPHEKSAAPGVELEGAEMEALIKKDPVAWRSRAMRLHDVAMEALRTIDARDPKPLHDIGERLDGACENCHLQYWYPNQVLPPGYEEPAPSSQSTGTANKPQPSL